jgi:hypothetical protein
MVTTYALMLQRNSANFPHTKSVAKAGSTKQGWLNKKLSLLG